MVDRGIPRHGYAIKIDTETIGEVSSGSHSPTLDTSIGLGYVPSGHTGVGTRFMVAVGAGAKKAGIVAGNHVHGGQVLGVLY